MPLSLTPGCINLQFIPQVQFPVETEVRSEWVCKAEHVVSFLRLCLCGSPGTEPGAAALRAGGRPDSVPRAPSYLTTHHTHEPAPEQAPRSPLHSPPTKPGQLCKCTGSLLTPEPLLCIHSGSKAGGLAGLEQTLGQEASCEQHFLRALKWLGPSFRGDRTPVPESLCESFLSS